MDEPNMTVRWVLSRRFGFTLSHLQSPRFCRSDSVTSENVVVVEGPPVRWIDNMDAKNSVIVALSAFYAIVMTIFALVFELSHLLSPERRRTVNSKDLFFGLYMYGISIVFLFYCYVVLLLNPRWKATLQKLKIMVHRMGNESTDSLEDLAASIHRKVTHDSPSAGSLFLRLGSVVFGVIGTVYHAFNAFLCTSDDDCRALMITIDIFSIVFIFTQMHFVFCNWKISITGSQTIARFGTMHLVAANLWTWIRYILIEEGVMDREIREIFSTKENETVQKENRYCEGAECILGSFSEIMYTSMVEYSLIGAAVMFIVWRNIDHDKVATVYVRRKHQIRMDCSKTTSGLFFGLAFLAGTFTSIAVFYGYTIMGNNHVAAMVFGATDIIQYVIASLGCIYALWQMRSLRYSGASVDGVPRRDGSPNHVLLDMILLSLGMGGEMIYSVAGLVGLTGDGRWRPLSIVLLIVHITRIAQVGLQSSLIYISTKLRICGDPELKHSQPGKQAITFLLIANIAMFLMNLLESEKAGLDMSWNPNRSSFAGFGNQFGGRRSAIVQQNQRRQFVPGYHRDYTDVVLQQAVSSVDLILAVVRAELENVLEFVPSVDIRRIADKVKQCYANLSWDVIGHVFQKVFGKNAPRAIYGKEAFLDEESLIRDNFDDMNDFDDISSIGGTSTAAASSAADAKRIAELESQMAELKAMFAALQNQNAKPNISNTKGGSPPPPDPIKQMGVAPLCKAPPPPPPPPPPMLLRPVANVAKPVEKKALSTESVQAKSSAEGMANSGDGMLSSLEMIKSGKVFLRKTQHTPGGTPVRHCRASDSDEGFLMSALKKKFINIERDDDNESFGSNQFEDEWEEEEENLHP